MTPEDFKTLLEQMEARLSGQLEDLNEANQELIRQLNDQEEEPISMETTALPPPSDAEALSIYPRWGISQRAIELFGWISDEERRIEYMWRYSQIEFARASRHTVLWAGHVTMLLEGLAKDCLPALALHFGKNQASRNNQILQRLFDNPEKLEDYDRAKSNYFKDPYFLQEATRSNSIAVIGNMPGRFIVMYEPDVEWCVFEKFQFDEKSSTLYFKEIPSQKSYQIQVSKTKATCIFKSQIEAILVKKDDLTREGLIDVADIFFVLQLNEINRTERRDEATGKVFNNYFFKIGGQVARYGTDAKYKSNRRRLDVTPISLRVKPTKSGRDFLTIEIPKKGTFGKILEQFPGVSTAESIGIYLSAIQSLNNSGLNATFEDHALNRIIDIRHDYAHMNSTHLARNGELHEFFDNSIHPLLEKMTAFFKSHENSNWLE